MVVQQAMAAGLAVVASDVGGIPDQIRHEVSGLLFAPGDERALASLFARLARDAALSARLGDAAKREATGRYRASAVAEGTRTVYRTALDPSASPRQLARIA